MAKFLMQEILVEYEPETARLGSASGSANYLTDKDNGKFVTFAGESRYNLAVQGAPIEAFIISIESASQDDYSIGSVVDEGRRTVMFDGLEATAGTGTIALGDYVVVGTVVAKGTALTDAAPVKVCKATCQPGSVPASLTEAGRQAQLAVYAWRVVSLGTGGVGTVGGIGVIERVSG